MRLFCISPAEYLESIQETIDLASAYLTLQNSVQLWNMLVPPQLAPSKARRMPSNMNDDVQISEVFKAFQNDLHQ